jgi:hypothetical protein
MGSFDVGGEVGIGATMAVVVTVTISETVAVVVR